MNRPGSSQDVFDVDTTADQEILDAIDEHYARTFSHEQELTRNSSPISEGNGVIMDKLVLMPESISSDGESIGKDVIHVLSTLNSKERSVATEVEEGSPSGSTKHPRSRDSSPCSPTTFPGAIHISPTLERNELDVECPTSSSIHSYHAEDNGNALVAAYLVEETSETSRANKIPDEKQFGNWRTASAILLCLLAAAAVAISFFIVNSNKEPVMNNTPQGDQQGSHHGNKAIGSETMRANQLLMGHVAQGFSETTQVAMESNTTAQWTALEWLVSNHDLSQFDTFRIVQRYALATLFHSTGGDQYWARDTAATWLDADTHECDWHQSDHAELPKFCWETGEIHTLALYEQGLYGTVPAEIALLSSLEDATLSENDLYGTLPTEILSMPNLEFLSLRNNEFGGPLPLFTNRNLVELDLGDNQWQGTLPRQYASLSELVVLTLNQNNGLTGTIPKAYARLPLEILELDSTNVWGEVPISLCPKDHSALEEEPNFSVDCDMVQCSCCGCP